MADKVLIRNSRENELNVHSSTQVSCRPPYRELVFPLSTIGIGSFQSTEQTANRLPPAVHSVGPERDEFIGKATCSLSVKRGGSIPARVHRLAAALGYAEVCILRRVRRGNSHRRLVPKYGPIEPRLMTYHLSLSALLFAYYLVTFPRYITKLIARGPTETANLDG